MSLYYENGDERYINSKSWLSDYTAIEQEKMAAIFQ
jgi:hypothetical protein